MRKKMRYRKIIAQKTNDPSEIVRLLQESEAIIFPERLYNLATDILLTVEENLPAHVSKDIVASYLLRAAFILNRDGQLVLEPPKPPKTP